MGYGLTKNGDLIILNGMDLPTWAARSAADFPTADEALRRGPEEIHFSPHSPNELGMGVQFQGLRAPTGWMRKGDIIEVKGFRVPETASPSATSVDPEM